MAIFPKTVVISNDWIIEDTRNFSLVHSTYPELNLFWSGLECGKKIPPSYKDLLKTNGSIEGLPLEEVKEIENLVIDFKNMKPSKKNERLPEEKLLARIEEIKDNSKLKSMVFIFGSTLEISNATRGMIMKIYGNAQNVYIDSQDFSAVADLLNGLPNHIVKMFSKLKYLKTELSSHEEFEHLLWFLSIADLSKLEHLQLSFNYTIQSNIDFQLFPGLKSLVLKQKCKNPEYFEKWVANIDRQELKNLQDLSILDLHNTKLGHSTFFSLMTSSTVCDQSLITLVLTFAKKKSNAHDIVLSPGLNTVDFPHFKIPVKHLMVLGVNNTETKVIKRFIDHCLNLELLVKAFIEKELDSSLGNVHDVWTQRCEALPQRRAITYKKYKRLKSDMMKHSHGALTL